MIPVELLKELSMLLSFLKINIDKNVEINDTGRAIKGTIKALIFPKNK